MIEILVFTKDEGREGVLRLRRGKGFPVVARLGPCSWGGSESLPDFVVVRITDTNDLEEWTDGYIRKTSYSILEHDTAIDSFKVKIFPQDKYPICQITTTEMQEFLLKWGARKIESDAEDLGIVFELKAMDAISHKGLFTFGEEDSFLKYNEISYDMATGEHQVMIDYSLSNIAESEIIRALTNAKFVIDTIDHEQGICLFTGYRHIMISQLEIQVEQSFHKLLLRSQWRFSDATVEAAILNNGITEMTVEQVEADMINVLDSL